MIFGIILCGLLFFAFVGSSSVLSWRRFSLIVFVDWEDFVGFDG
jgi:hypothetical protein